MSKNGAEMLYGYSFEELLCFAERHLAKNYSWRKDLMIVGGQGSKAYDHTGKEYLDFIACYSALNVGHAHPEVVKAIISQLGRGYTAGTRKFLHPPIVLFAKTLSEMCGKDIVLPKVTGAEAVETAVKVAKRWTYINKGIEDDKAEIISCKGSFHGRTYHALSLMDNLEYRKYFGPFIPGVIHIPFNDLGALKSAVNKNTAAFIVEPIQGEGGINVPDPNFLLGAQTICYENKVVFIADEVQTGFGRTGQMFGCDWEGVVPDIYVFAKAIGGGIAISAMAGNEDIMSVMGDGSDGSTFGGNPLSCAAAVAAMKVIKEEKLHKRAFDLGRKFLSGLNWIWVSNRHNYIKEVRGTGLMIGLEISENSPISARDFCDMLFKEGILCCETRKSVIRLTPPLVITEKELDFALEKIEKVFTSKKAPV